MTAGAMDLARRVRKLSLYFGLFSRSECALPAKGGQDALAECFLLK